MQAMPRDQLREAVARAFLNVPSPATREEMFFKVFVDGEDAAAAAEAFQFRPWRELSIKELFVEGAAFGFMSPQGFRAYLPAYLTACFATDDALDNYAGDLMTYTVLGLIVSDSTDPARAERVAARNAILDKPQRAAVIAVLQYLESRVSLAREALDEWSVSAA